MNKKIFRMMLVVIFMLVGLLALPRVSKAETQSYTVNFSEVCNAGQETYWFGDFRLVLNCEYQGEVAAFRLYGPNGSTVTVDYSTATKSGTVGGTIANGVLSRTIYENSPIQRLVFNATLPVVSTPTPVVTPPPATPVPTEPTVPPVVTPTAPPVVTPVPTPMVPPTASTPVPEEEQGVCSPGRDFHGEIVKDANGLANWANVWVDQGSKCYSALFVLVAYDADEVAPGVYQRANFNSVWIGPGQSSSFAVVLPTGYSHVFLYQSLTPREPFVQLRNGEAYWGSRIDYELVLNPPAR